jgi:hypothetical protein
MANPHRGEVVLKPAFPVEEGKPDAPAPEEYTFVLRTSEVMALEDLFDCKFAKLAHMLENDLGFSDMVEVLRVGLERHHGAKTKAMLADLVDACGPKTVIEAIGKSIAGSFPDLVEAGAQAQAAGKARASIGRRSGAAQLKRA